MIEVNANGADIPAIGFGTWCLKDKSCSELVAKAINSGYRHIDTAAMYDNEQAVGEGISAGLMNSQINREDLFVTTKVWHADIGEGDLQQSVENSLRKLNLQQVDLVLIHWPSKVIPLAESINALNSVKNSGLAKHIGVSNFTIPLLDEAVSLSENPLICNQVENHPYLDQSRILEACRKHNMAMTSYCPLSRAGDLFEELAVLDASRAHNKTPAQVVLRWHVQQTGVIAIPRTSNPDRISENIDIFDFELTAEEMSKINKLGARNMRICDFDFSPQWDEPNA